jgi:ketosteroid isomerase-like protein
MARRMLDPTRAQAFADEWYAAWNARDLERVMAHWAEDAVFTSPLAAKLIPESGGTVTGKDALRDYWRRGLELNPDLHFEPRALLVGDESIVLSYTNHRGQECAELLVLGDDGLAHRGVAHYAVETA